MASAAEAPQMPTAPPDRMPNERVRPSQRAAKAPRVMVEVTATTTVAMGIRPRPTIWLTVIFAPSRATPMRRMDLDENSIPATQRPSSCRKWNAMPSSRANSMTGAV